MADIAATPAPTSPSSKPTSGLREFWFYFSQNTGAVIGLVLFILLVLAAAFAPWLAPHDPAFQYRDAFLTPPAWQAGGRPEFIFGTDAIGRDILSRLIHGARYSLLIGAVAAFVVIATVMLLTRNINWYGKDPDPA